MVEGMEALHGLRLGLGSVAAIQNQVSQALEQPVETARKYVHRQPVNHLDETGWPEGDQDHWMWIGVTPEVTVFRILKGRGQAEARKMIGKGFAGIVSTDRYAAYHWVDGHRRQMCWAHIKRDLLAIKERGGLSTEIGAGLLAEVEEIFKAWHELKAGSLSRDVFREAMEPVRAASQRPDRERLSLRSGEDAADVPEPAQTRGLIMDLCAGGGGGADHQ